jgi:hypothetical protein
MSDGLGLERSIMMMHRQKCDVYQHRKIIIASKRYIYDILVTLQYAACYMVINIKLYNKYTINQYR